MRSILPIVDKYIYACGKSDDNTRERVETVAKEFPGKVEIIDTIWPDIKDGGKVLAVEANKAMEAAEQSGCTWGFYGQADEIYHEQDLPIIQSAADAWADTPDVKALLFWYYHFVLDYQTTDPWMYHKASRLVRLDQSCYIVGDCCGPGVKNYTGKVHGGNGYLDKHHLGGHVRWCRDPEGKVGNGRKAFVYHYGWVKTREQFETKLEMVGDLWWGELDEKAMKKKLDDKFGRMFARYPILKNFKGTHPAVMKEYVDNHPQYGPSRNRWLKPGFYAEILRHGFHG